MAGGILVWGKGYDVAPTDATETRRCDQCQTIRQFRIHVRYQYTHVFFVFGMVRGREYALVCETCGKAVFLGKAEARSRIGKDPIPFMRRWGWLVYAVGGAVLVVGMMAAMIFSGP